MEAVAAKIDVHRRASAEEAGRADFYALLARLFHAGPDAVLLGQLANAAPVPSGGSAALAKAWRELAEASSAMDGDAAAEEYERLFVGVGKAPVSIYAGFHSGATAIGHPRVRLQASFTRLGLAPRESSSQPEDHFAGLFDVMRVLVAGGAGRVAAPLEEQRLFFDEHVKPGVGKFLAAVERAGEANYYRKVAALAAAFIALEIESFDLD